MRLRHAPVEAPIRSEAIDRLSVRVYKDRTVLGRAAASAVASRIGESIRADGEARVILASAPSQIEFWAALALLKIDWAKVVVFNVDEYVGLGDGAAHSFATYLSTHLLSRVKPGSVQCIDGSRFYTEEIVRYEELIRERPIDIACLGIGENAHLAFNDPGVADFSEPASIKLVEVSRESRKQQVNDGLFGRLNDVPTHALTLTIPALMAAKHVSCVVPGIRKRPAVAAILRHPIHADRPASVLRTHSSAVLYLDRDSDDRA